MIREPVHKLSSKLIKLWEDPYQTKSTQILMQQKSSDLTEKNNRRDRGPYHAFV